MHGPTRGRPAGLASDPAVGVASEASAQPAFVLRTPVDTEEPATHHLRGRMGRHPHRAVFDQILDADGTVLVCLHHWGDHGHPSLMEPHRAEAGNGVLLFFRVDDFDNRLQAAHALAPRFEDEPHTNVNTGTMEFSLRDPDGYYVTINAA